MEISEIDGRLTEQYEAKMQKSLAVSILNLLLWSITFPVLQNETFLTLFSYHRSYAKLMTNRQKRTKKNFPRCTMIK